MISVREFVASLAYPTELLAGGAGWDKLCRDIILLSDEKVWLQNTENSEFADTLVFVKAHVFPAYSSTFDLLLRFFQQAGVVGIVFQGGKRSDFSKATLMLADHLGLPLVWIDAPINYSVFARQFYTIFVQRTQQARQRIRQVRGRLEAAFHESFTLDAWMDTIEHELFVTATLRLTDRGQLGLLKAKWQSRDGRRTLQVPIQVLHQAFLLELLPNEPCPLLHADEELLWIEEFTGVLSAQTGYFLLAELPGLASQSEWACSFESALYYSVSRLPVIRANDLGNLTRSAAQMPELHESLSARRRLELISANQVHSVGLLWVSSSGDGVDRPQRLHRIADRPYAYRSFSQVTLNLREQALRLCEDSRYAFGTQSALTSCVPWKDWRDNEGVVLFCFGLPRNGVNGVEQMVRELIHQLEIRLQTSLRSYFVRRNVVGMSHAADLLQVAGAMTERSYVDFLSVLSQTKSVQFADHSGDVVNRILPAPAEDSSYEHVLQVLKPLVEDKGNFPLLEALEAYLECGAKMQAAAEKLYLHRNTLRYRLKRAEKLLNVSLDDDQIRFTYQLAIRTWRLRNPSPLS